VAGTRVEDSTVQTSAGEPSVVEFVAAPVAAKATMITVLEVSAMTSVSYCWSYPYTNGVGFCLHGDYLDHHRKGIRERTSRVISSHGYHGRIGASDGTTIVHFHEVLQ